MGIVFIELCFIWSYFGSSGRSQGLPVQRLKRPIPGTKGIEVLLFGQQSVLIPTR